MDLDFEDEWYGWRLRGRHLVSDEGLRIPMERLRGLIWREQMELYRAGFASRRQAEANKRRRGRQLVKVVVVTLDQYRLNGVAAG